MINAKFNAHGAPTGKEGGPHGAPTGKEGGLHGAPEGFINHHHFIRGGGLLITIRELFTIIQVFLTTSMAGTLQKLLLNTFQYFLICLYMF